MTRGSMDNAARVLPDAVEGDHRLLSFQEWSEINSQIEALGAWTR